MAQNEPDNILDEADRRLEQIAQKDEETLVRLCRALDVAAEASAMVTEEEDVTEDDFDLVDPVDDAEHLDFGTTLVVLRNEPYDYTIDHIQETDPFEGVSGFRFVKPDGTVVAEPGSEVDLTGIHNTGDDA